MLNKLKQNMTRPLTILYKEYKPSEKEHLQLTKDYDSYKEQVLFINNSGIPKEPIEFFTYPLIPYYIFDVIEFNLNIFRNKFFELSDQELEDRLRNQTDIYELLKSFILECVEFDEDFKNAFNIQCDLFQKNVSTTFEFSKDSIPDTLKQFNDLWAYLFYVENWETKKHFKDLNCTERLPLYQMVKCCEVYLIEFHDKNTFFEENVL